MFRAQQWNSQIWLNWWYKVTNTRNGDTRLPRAKVFQNNLDIFTDGAYKTESNAVVMLPADRCHIDGACIYTAPIELPASFRHYSDMQVAVVNQDCVLAAKRLIDRGLNPALLNMASLYHPGGGVIDGCGAQEENLCRRSNLVQSLYQFSLKGGRYGDLAQMVGVKRREGAGYPMDERYGGIYSPGVCFFRSTEDYGYALLEEPFRLAVVSVASINYNPRRAQHLLVDGNIPEADVPVLKDKIRTILRIGLLKGHDSMVLGALGCGAFCTPPAQMARLFQQVLLEPEFAGRFARVEFAILDNGNALRHDSPEGNFKPFQRELDQSV